MPLRSLLLVACLGLVLPAQAFAMKLDPGQWEFELTATNTMAPDAQKKTTQQCVKEPEMTPQQFMQEAQGCQISDAENSDSAMKWKLTCGPAGEMKGDATFTSTGSTVQGSMRMGMSIQGQNVSMEQTWSGKRVGDCP